MRATITTAVVAAVLYGAERLDMLDVPTWGWTLLAVAAGVAIATDLALAAAKRRAARP